MRKETDFLIEQLNDTYKGDPWFGRNARSLLSEVNEKTAYIKLNGQHSILELVWHMCNWREFAIHHLQPSSGLSLKHFEKMDWRQLDHNDQSLWQQGLERLSATQTVLLRLLQQQDDSLLEKNVHERDYNYRKLISGIIQHDIYHLGQIAHIAKQVKNG